MRVGKRDHNGADNPNWKGGNRAFGGKYRMQFSPEHPRACKNYVLEHRLIAEKALGKLLPLHAVVHHHSTKQLVVCQNRAYHNLIHKRMRAFYACGHANWVKCCYCQTWDNPETGNMWVNKKTGAAHHRKCDNVAHVQARLDKKKYKQ